MNRSEEDYIKTIYELSINHENKIIKNTEIAENLGFTDQSVNEMVKKLSKKGYLEFIPYKGVILTNEGNKEAIRMIRAHRVWEVFLMTNLGYAWQEVHSQAELLEHAGNDDLIDRLYDYLDKPKYCGHGNPIPDQNGKIANVFKKALYLFNENETFTLKRVLDVKDLLIYLDDKNIHINQTFKIIEKNSFDDSIKLVGNDSVEYIITSKISKMLFGI